MRLADSAGSSALAARLMRADKWAICVRGARADRLTPRRKRCIGIDIQKQWAYYIRVRIYRIYRRFDYEDTLLRRVESLSAAVMILYPYI